MPDIEEEKNTETTNKTTKAIKASTPPVVPAHSANRALFISIALVVGILVLLGAGIGGGMLIQKSLAPTDAPSLSSGVDGNATVTQAESSIAAVAEKVTPSVVSIVSTTRTQSSFRSATGEAAGTGVIVSKDGYVMTNNHVIDGSSKVTVIDSEGNQYKNVTVVGRDPLNDIAFLKIKANKDFTAAELGNSSTIRIGQQVIAIGNALGQYSNSVTSGIISGTGRPITASSGGTGGQTESLTDLIQTDASINPGNSGGPLVNMAGQVIGINTAIVEDANGIGFAIPINSTKGVLAGVLETGKVSRAFLGVTFLTIAPDVVEEYDLPVKQGAYIPSGNSSVSAGSPAAQAGLKGGDIITKINDTPIGAAGGLSSVIGQYRPGDKVTITYLRDGKTSTVSVTFSEYTP